MKTNWIKTKDGKRKITVKMFDELFDSGSDKIDDFVDWSNARRPGRGGTRKGAGRKPSGRMPYMTRLHPNLIKKIKQNARKNRSSECVVIERALKKFLVS